MRIAILGTRGIPNNYGGFEQLAEFLSAGLKKHGHDVFVYCSSQHSYKSDTWNDVNLIHKYDPEKNIGTIAQFIYDFNCVIDSRKRNFDCVLNLGYTSSSIWLKFISKKTRVITNMDGLEWKRTKYSKAVQRFLMYAERVAVKRSDLLVADSLGIKDYLQKKYNVDSTFIAYGANLFEKPDDSILQKFDTTAYAYNMLIARMEPENNLEIILDGVTASLDTKKFFVVGNYKNKFGLYLFEKYKNDKRIIFTGPIYESAIIDNMRYYSNMYFHGHSVGGTNPSLLEAMGCKCLVAAHNNMFNKSVLQNDAYYFETAVDVSRLIEKCTKTDAVNKSFINNNFERIKTNYSWPKIICEYEKAILDK